MPARTEATVPWQVERSESRQSERRQTRKRVPPTGEDCGKVREHGVLRQGAESVGRGGKVSTQWKRVSAVIPHNGNMFPGGNRCVFVCRCGGLVRRRGGGGEREQRGIGVFGLSRCCGPGWGRDA